MVSGGGVMSAENVRRVTQALDIDIANLLLRLVPLAAAYALAPVSRYLVGAVAQGTRVDKYGYASLYLGANMEFLQRPLSYSLHAEQAAIANAWFHREPGVQTVAASAVPCGYCRQFLKELSDTCLVNILFPKSDGAGYLSTDIAGLLPNAFGPADLGHKGGMMAVMNAPQDLQLIPADGGGTASAVQDKVVSAALDAARFSYAPYTNNFSGCALQLCDGTIFAGSSAENAAHNPGLSPLHAALSNMRMGVGPAFPAGAPTQISRCVLVESAADTSQRELAGSLLSSLAPGVSLEYFPMSPRS